jgi:parallel beta-helix repeat protein
VIRNSIFEGSGGVGISRGSDSEITGNSFVQGHIGIQLSYCDSIRVVDNNLNSHGGMYLHAVQNSSISYNTIISSGRRGLELLYGTNNLYEGNRFSEISTHGIYIKFEQGSTFAFNELTLNEGYGISLESGDSNRFYGNLFARNRDGSALDNGNENEWDNGENLGNCWGFSNSTSPMGIEGTGDSIDHYPVVSFDNELLSPVIAHRYNTTSPLDTEDDALDITWCHWGESGEVTVFVDGTIELDQSCRGCGSVSISVSEFGEANYTLRIVDIYGNIEICTIDLAMEQRALQGTIVSVLSLIGASALVAVTIIWDSRNRANKNEKKRGVEDEEEEIKKALSDLQTS